MHTVPPLPEGCPWSTWTRPNIDWCEENLCACALLAASATSSALDLSRILCDPTNHWISGHAVWHVLTATALWVLSLYYARQPRPENPHA